MFEGLLERVDRTILSHERIGAHGTLSEEAILSAEDKLLMGGLAAVAFYGPPVGFFLFDPEKATVQNSQRVDQYTLEIVESRPSRNGLTFEDIDLNLLVQVSPATSTVGSRTLSARSFTDSLVKMSADIDAILYWPREARDKYIGKVAGKVGIEEDEVRNLLSFLPGLEREA
jgi:hypothetical protein